MDVVVLRLTNLVVFMIVFVPISQRLLGVRFGFGRLTIGALITLSVSGPLAIAVIGTPPWTGSNGAAVAFMVLIALASMLAGLVFLVLAEALVPTGSLPRARDLRRDPIAATDALLEIVHRPDVIDERSLERAVGQFMTRHLAAGVTLGPAMFNDLFKIITSHELGVPPEVAAVFRALATIEGTISRISPGFDLVAASRQFATAHVTDRLAPDAIRRTATEELAQLLPMLRRLPRRIDRIAAAAESGRLGVNVRLFADERDRRHFTGLLHQALLAVLGATAGIMAVLLLGTPGGPRITETMTLFQLFGYNLLVICAVLVLRVLVLIFRLPGKA